MRSTSWLAKYLGLVFLFAAAGCGGTPSGNFAQVSGNITQGGAPVDGAKITFHSTVETKGQRETFSAITDSSGKYVLSTAGKDPGIPPGLYKVTITKQGFKDAKMSGGIENDPGQMEAQFSSNPGAAKNAMPKEYETPAATKLSVTLEVGKNEGKNFDLPK